MSITPEVATPGSSTDKEILEDLRRNADLYIFNQGVMQSYFTAFTWLPLDRTLPGPEQGGSDLYLDVWLLHE